MFTAASTREAVEELAQAFEQERGIAVQVVADDSSRLAQQIVQGAPAAVFLSAHAEWTDELSRLGRTAEVVPLLRNELVLVVPRGNRHGITSPEQLPGGPLVAVAAERVPAGVYARQAFATHNVLAPLLAEGKLIAGDSVRSVVAYVERGEVAAGVVYRTDAALSDQLEVVYTFAAQSHEAIVYPLARLTGERVPAHAEDWFRYLQSPTAQVVWQRYGFELHAE
jgi:molybdate transport system substrate-binding protein